MIGAVLLLSVSTIASADAPVATLVQARELLLARKYAVLTRLLEDQQSVAAANPVKGEELDWTLNAFRLPNTATGPLIDDWAAASPNSWAPLLARAVNSGARSRQARGSRWASETSDGQFRRMAQLGASMRSDCGRVLALNRAVCPCYEELVLAARNDGAEPAQLVKEAIGACPRNYGLHVEHVFSLTPRWGGSYAKMEMAIELARKAGLDDAQVKSLEGYISIDKASILRIEGKLEEARQILNQAIFKSPTALLFEERAELENHRRQNSLGALMDANAAVEMSHGGWMFSIGRLARLLLARAWALDSLGRREDARKDIGLALEIAPADEDVKYWQARLGMRSAIERR